MNDGADKQLNDQTTTLESKANKTENGNEGVSILCFGDSWAFPGE
jgi:hypothetical protein